MQSQLFYKMTNGLTGRLKPASGDHHMQSLAVMSHLSPDEVARYRRDGFVVPQYRLPAARVAKMRDALDELLRLNPTVRPEKLVSAHIHHRGAGGGGGVRGVAAFLDLARDPEIVGLVSDIIGEDVILWGAHVFCKPAGEGYETPWHQVRDACHCMVQLVQA